MAEWDNDRPAGAFQNMATMTYGSGYPGSPEGQHWAEFQAGAREVWEAVRPLLTEIGDHGETLPTDQREVAP